MNPTKQTESERRDDANKAKGRAASRERNLVPGKNDVKTRFGVAFERSSRTPSRPGRPGKDRGVRGFHHQFRSTADDQEMPLAPGGSSIHDSEIDR